METTTEPQTLAVYKAINAVQSAMNKEGISKGRKNQQQGYAFRGIDDCYAAVAPHLAEQQLCIIPRYVTRSVVEHEAKSGAALFYVTVEGEFDFVSAIDGSKHTARMFGEAMDSADKATNKAASSAFKYLLLQTFCIPTEGDNDADLTTPEPLARRQQEPPQSPAKPATARPGEPQAQEGPDSEVSTEAVLDGWKTVKGKSKKSGKPYELTTLNFTDGHDKKFSVTTFVADFEKLEVLKGQLLEVKHKPDWKGVGRELIDMSPADNVSM